MTVLPFLIKDIQTRKSPQLAVGLKIILTDVGGREVVQFGHRLGFDRLQLGRRWVCGRIKIWPAVSIW